MTLNVGKVVAVAAFCAAVSEGLLVARHEHRYADDCGKESHLRIIPGSLSLLQQDNVPGAGIDKFEPFKLVMKDGFLKTKCVKDYMYYHGDKFGDNKFEYKLGKVSDVSIVHYKAHVASEDRKDMTQKVCFEFCRTVPNMGFFGIVNGRDCYCTPYFEAMASDSSECDSVCEGDNTLMCGGEAKSSIFTMHQCGSTKKDLKERSEHSESMASDIKTLADTSKEYARILTTAAGQFQPLFGQFGDTIGSGLSQNAKVWAGTLGHTADDAIAVADKLEDLAGKKEKLTDYTDPTTVTKAERTMEAIDKTMGEGESMKDKLNKQNDETGLKDDQIHAGAIKQYYPAMYFVDKEYAEVPSTCNGVVLGNDARVGDKDACASMCDANGASCVGFFYGEFGSPGPDFLAGCTLFSSFKDALYYSGCKGKEGPGFFTCYAKFSKFSGLTLKPDPSGKCKHCFKELTKADRCPFP